MTVCKPWKSVYAGDSLTYQRRECNHRDACYCQNSLEKHSTTLVNKVVHINARLRSQWNVLLHVVVKYIVIVLDISFPYYKKRMPAILLTVFIWMRQQMSDTNKTIRMQDTRKADCCLASSVARSRSANAVSLIRVPIAPSPHLSVLQHKKGSLSSYYGVKDCRY